MSELQDSTIEVQVNPVRLRDRGQITIPQAVRDRLDMNAGELLTLLQIGDVILLTPKQPQVPRLADEIADMMEAEGVGLADLLAGLKKEREALWRERQDNA